MVRFRLLCGDFLLPNPAPYLDNRMTVCMGYPAKTLRRRAGKRRRKGAGNPCRENGETLIPQLPENNVVKLTTLFFCNASERRGISMYVTNEEWEQNNQDYLKESYEETGFTTGGYAIRKLICGGVLHHHLHQEILSQLLVRQSGQQSAAARIPPNAPSRFSLPVLRRKIHAQTCRCPLLQQCLSAKRLSKTCCGCCKCSK
jgi:hypothetical protein